MERAQQLSQVERARKLHKTGSNSSLSKSISGTSLTRTDSFRLDRRHEQKQIVEETEKHPDGRISKRKVSTIETETLTIQQRIQIAYQTFECRFKEEKIQEFQAIHDGNFFTVPEHPFMLHSYAELSWEDCERYFRTQWDVTRDIIFPNAFSWKTNTDSNVEERVTWLHKLVDRQRLEGQVRDHSVLWNTKEQWMNEVIGLQNALVFAFDVYDTIDELALDLPTEQWKDPMQAYNVLSAKLPGSALSFKHKVAENAFNLIEQFANGNYSKLINALFSAQLIYRCRTLKPEQWNKFAKNLHIESLNNEFSTNVNVQMFGRESKVEMFSLQIQYVPKGCVYEVLLPKDVTLKVFWKDLHESIQSNFVPALYERLIEIQDEDHVEKFENGIKVPYRLCHEPEFAPLLREKQLAEAKKTDKEVKKLIAQKEAAQKEGQKLLGFLQR
jgi:hypothetical protein